MDTKVRVPPKVTALEFDLCDHFHYAQDHRCQSYWRHEVTLDHGTEVHGRSMFGTYPPGVWRFCNTHYRIFERDREDT